MTDRGRTRRMLALLLAGSALAACASGGGSPPPVAPAAVPPPPPPPPAPTPANSLDTPEYRRTGTATGANVLPVWAAGHEGRGVTVGLVDTGIALDSPEFAGRIAPQSRDVTGAGRSIRDDDGHGTAVAAILAAARNDRAIVGIAPQATIAMMRGDRAGSCSTEAGCGFTDSSLAAGINAAVDAGAKVLNISLGGSSGSSAVRAAWARATGNGTILVIGAGNDSAAEIDPLPRSALAAANPALVIVVGAATAAGEIASFSNRAGAAQNNYLLAPGAAVRSFDHTGQEFLYSGTSLAAPVVAGAAALLAGAFPNLSAAQIVELLLITADDRGAPGIDPVTGRGLLNIGRAFQPQGPTTLAGSRTPVSLTANGSPGPALGTSFGTALGQILVEDGYGRPYALDIGATLAPSSPARLGAALLESPAAAASASLSLGAATLALTGTARRHLPGLPPGADPDAGLGLAHRGLGPFSAAARARLADAGLTLAAGPLRLAAGSGIAAPPLPGEGAVPALVATDALGLSPAQGMLRERLVAETRLGPLSLALGRTRSVQPGRRPGEPAGGDANTTRTSLALAAERGAVEVAVQLATETEEGGLLGSRLGPAFGIAGAEGRVLGGAVAVDLARIGLGPVALRLAASRGWHALRVSGAGLVDEASGLGSSAWSAGLEAPLGPGRLALAAAAPQRLDRGTLRIRPAPGDSRLVLLGGGARELAVEGSYAFGPLALSLFHRAHAGHQEGLADTGAALRFRLGF